MWILEREKKERIGMEMGNSSSPPLPRGFLNSLPGCWASSSAEPIWTFPFQKALKSHEEAVLHCGWSQPDLASDSVWLCGQAVLTLWASVSLNNEDGDNSTYIYHESSVCSLSHPIPKHVRFDLIYGHFSHGEAEAQRMELQWAEQLQSERKALSQDRPYFRPVGYTFGVFVTTLRFSNSLEQLTELRKALLVSTVLWWQKDTNENQSRKDKQGRD